MKMRRTVRALGLALALLAAAMAATVAWVETSCRAPAEPRAARPDVIRVDAPGYARPEVASYLSYPEWFIVHAYDDFAAVSRASSPSDFGYLSSIRSFWGSFCSVNRKAARLGADDLETRTMIYLIGFSFSAEMALKGLYETTIGRLTSFVSTQTEEDRFAQRLNDDYAAFLRHKPWYAYPFWSEERRFWSETPLTGAGMPRKVERRLGLSVEYAVKSAYAAGMGWLAGLSPAATRIGGVVKAPRAVLEADPRITIVAELAPDTFRIETDRYAALSDILRTIARGGGEIVEIAGNRDGLVTVLAQDERGTIGKPGETLFAHPVGARPGWTRYGLAIPLRDLAPLSAQGRGGRLRLRALL